MRTPASPSALMGLFALPLEGPGFRLEDGFLARFSDRQPDWGPVGYVTYKRTYARTQSPDGRGAFRGTAVGRSEEWWETLARVVEGTFEIQQRHAALCGLRWSAEEAREAAHQMYELMWDFRFLPPGRGLWMMGTDFVRRYGSAALNNCGFCSTAHVARDFARPFLFLMDMSMLGVGIGFDTLGRGTMTLQAPQRSSDIHVIEDSREGWLRATARLLRAYAPDERSRRDPATVPAAYDYRQIRPAGAPIRGFGGVAAGPGPLRRLLEEDLPSILDAAVGTPLSSEVIVDLANLIGRCVVSGNVRRSAEIAFGDPNDDRFLRLKDPETAGPALSGWRWTSNNSIRAEVGMNYERVAAQTAQNGEPGYLWLENARAYGRLADPADHRDAKVAGANPCVEQSLEDEELCCVSGDTRILTADGYPRIRDVVSQSVRVWNGTHWSDVQPFLAQTRARLFRVWLSDGSYLDATPDHGWSVQLDREDVFSRVETVDLRPGMLLEPCAPPPTEGGLPCPSAYAYGAEVGRIASATTPLDHLGDPSEETPSERTASDSALSPDSGAESISELPDEVFGWDRSSLAAFFGGWVDTGGCLRSHPEGDDYLIYGPANVLREAQMLLRRLGVQRAVVGTPHRQSPLPPDAPAKLWVPSWEASGLAPKLRGATRAGPRLPHAPQRILGIELLPGEHPTYCFSEPIRHRGVFANVLTYQCLVETFPARHENYPSFKRTLSSAFLYAKTVTLLPTHDAAANAVLLRNRRIGTSQSGIVQNFARVGRREHLRWCDQGYQHLKELDATYSDRWAVPRSVKITSVKPSGTVSKLCGATSGIHYPPAQFYIQRIRFPENNPLVAELRARGYPVEPDTYTPNTSVVEFPVEERDFLKGSPDVSMWEQLMNAAQMQKYWADNQVSCTVSFAAHEASDIPAALELFEDQLKGISFLPRSEHGYVQAPWEPISEFEYRRRRAAITPIEPVSIDTEARPVLYCDGETCTLPNQGSRPIGPETPEKAAFHPGEAPAPASQPRAVSA